MTESLVSILIVVWNSAAFLPRCLLSLSTQTYSDFEIIIVDNGSTDDGILGLKEKFPALKLTVKRLESNRGFAFANNLGARLARGKWLALLNADAFPEPDWLEQLLHAADENPSFSFFASRQIQANNPDLLDGAGDAYHIGGVAWSKYHNRLVNQFGFKQEEAFSARAAAALYSREEFLNAGGFDEDYFSYFEDVDLGFRLRLKGARCLYVPHAIAHHIGSASTSKKSDFSVYYGYRNFIWTFVKNMPFPLFWLFLPLHIGTILFFAVYLTLRGQGSAIRRAIFDAVRGLPQTLTKRRMIQSGVQITPPDLLRAMSTDLFEPSLEFIARYKSK